MKQCDKCIIVLTMSLVLIGIIMVYSTTAVVAPGSADAGKLKLIHFNYLKKHLFSLFVGLSMMAVAYKMSLNFIKKSALPLLLFAVFLLFMVFVPEIGRTINGASRWIRVGSMTFQPSEIAKLAMIVFLAKYLSSVNFKTDKISFFIIPITIMVFIQATLLFQPDFGTAFIIGLLTFSLLFVAGVRIKYLLSVTVVLIPVIIKLIMEPYRMKRVLTFLNPWSDPRGDGFQLIQSFYAFGNGGLEGVGIGKSTQKLSFLPESKTDFIFSIIGEETGFAGSLVVVFLFLFFFIRGLVIINKSKDNFMFFLSTGILLMIVFQAVINMGVVTGLLPTKGLTLPFISYGGSSMMVNLTAVGLLLNVSKNKQEKKEKAIKRSDFINRRTAGMRTTRILNGSQISNLQRSRRALR